MKLFHLFAAVVMATALLAGPASGEDIEPEAGPDASAVAAPKAAWPVTCRSRDGQAELACSMSQVIATKTTGQRVIAATVLLDKGGKPVLRLNLPHGLMLPKGVTVSIDDAAAKTYPILTADKNGSYALVLVDDELASALKGGKALNVTVTRYSGGDVVFKLPLEGFAAGFARLQAS
jgi:invasion protein IalB